MEKIRMSRRHWMILLCSLALAACSSRLLRSDREGEIKQIAEFDSQVKIEVPVEAPAASPGTSTAMPDEKATGKAAEAKSDAKTVAKVDSIAGSTSPSTVVSTSGSRARAKTPTKAPRGKTKESQKDVPKVTGSVRRQPELEDDGGFIGRRPFADPFRVGERITHKVDYYGVSVGHMGLNVLPFALVNGKKSYQFEMTAKTSDWYSSVYRVEDRAVVLMDFETLVPSVYTLHVKESSQLKEARMLFKGNTATYWEKKITDKNGVEEKKEEWEILEYSQNIFSAAFYMRFFQWTPGKEVAFRVSDDKENLVFRGKALRKERLKTAAGEFNAVVVQPQVELKGKFKPVGDIFMWLSDDDRRYILRIEAKIKIGSLVSEVVEIKPGPL